MGRLVWILRFLLTKEVVIAENGNRFCERICERRWLLRKDFGEMMMMRSLKKEVKSIEK